MHDQLLNYLRLEKPAGISGVEDQMQQLNLAVLVRDTLHHSFQRYLWVAGYLLKNIDNLKAVCRYSDFEQRRFVGGKQFFFGPDWQTELALFGEIQVFFYQVLLLPGDNNHGKVQVFLRHEFER